MQCKNQIIYIYIYPIFNILFWLKKKSEKDEKELSVTQKDIFVYCTEELENATYRSAISIFEFLKDLVDMEWEKTPILVNYHFFFQPHQ